MNYEVVWNAVAERRLTQLWLSSRLRHAIRTSADEIDAMLQSNPRDCGESRDGDNRVMLVWPLGVYFEIDDGGKQVRVTSVWSFGP